MLVCHAVCIVKNVIETRILSLREEWPLEINMESQDAFYLAFL